MELAPSEGIHVKLCMQLVAQLEERIIYRKQRETHLWAHHRAVNKELKTRDECYHKSVENL